MSQQAVEPQFHVLLRGRTLGPYNWRTIVGMRVRQTLSSEDMLLGPDGRRLSVGELIDRRNRATQRAAHRSSGFSIVLASYEACLLGVEGAGHEIPRFRGLVEARVQADGLLRVAGRFRRGWRWREDRVKLPLEQVRHARVNATVVELWLQTGPQPEVLQRVVLDLFTPEAAGELVDWLPEATPWPGGELPLPAEPRRESPNPIRWLVAGAVAVFLASLALARRG